MSDSLFDILVEQLKVDEGLSLKPYKDTQGYLTIGYGRNLDGKGISQTEATFLLSNDINYVISQAKGIFENFDNLSVNRQSVICNMIFNLGLDKFLTFEHFIKAVNDSNFQLASQEMLHSLWASQVGQRALRLSDLMENG